MPYTASKIMLEDYTDVLAALEPYYGSDGGNNTRIYTVTGEVLHEERTVRWLIKKLGKMHAVDLEALRSTCGQHLAMAQRVPLPISPEVVLVPMTMRRTIADADGASGYVNLGAVEKVEALPVLKPGRKVNPAEKTSVAGTTSSAGKVNSAGKRSPAGKANSAGKVNTEGKVNSAGNISPAGHDDGLYRSVVFLKGGHKLYCCYHAGTVIKRLKAAGLLRERFMYRPGAGLPLLTGTMSGTDAFMERPGEEVNRDDLYRLLSIIAKGISSQNRDDR